MTACIEPSEHKSWMFHDVLRGDILMSICSTCRHSRGLQSIIYTLSQSARELGLLVLILIITGLAFSSLAYYIEQVKIIFKTLWHLFMSGRGFWIHRYTNSILLGDHNHDYSWVISLSYQTFVQSADCLISVITFSLYYSVKLKGKVKKKKHFKCIFRTFATQKIIRKFVFAYPLTIPCWKISLMFFETFLNVSSCCQVWGHLPSEWSGEAGGNILCYQWSSDHVTSSSHHCQQLWKVWLKTRLSLRFAR